jgi:ribosomal protein S18 acetylase RimI-like enzyme
MEIIVQGPFLQMAEVCAPILHALPGWFGIEAANVQYLKDIDVLPTWIALKGDEVAGFLTVKKHTSQAAEIHVVGVCPNLHRQGVGRALLLEVEQALRQQGIEYLQVKTLSASHPDKGYARTRAFYLAMGFRPLEEFPELWDPRNPCLQMVKYLGVIDPGNQGSQFAIYYPILAMILLLAVAWGFDRIFENLRRQFNQDFVATPLVLGSAITNLVFVASLILFTWLIFIRWQSSKLRAVIFVSIGAVITLFQPLMVLFPSPILVLDQLGLMALSAPLWNYGMKTFFLIAGVYLLVVGILDLVGVHVSNSRITRRGKHEATSILGSFLLLILTTGLLLSTCSQPAILTTNTAIPPAAASTSTLAATSIPTSTPTSLPTPDPAATPDPRLPIQSQKFTDLDQAQAAAEIPFLVPAFFPAPLPLCSIWVSDFLNGDQWVRILYCEPGEPLDNRLKGLDVILYRTDQGLSAENIQKDDLKTPPIDLQEVTVRNLPGWTYWNFSGAGGNWASLEWREDGINYRVGIHGNWPYPTKENQNIWAPLLLQVAESLQPFSTTTPNPTLPPEIYPSPSPFRTPINGLSASGCPNPQGIEKKEIHSLDDLFAIRMLYSGRVDSMRKASDPTFWDYFYLPTNGTPTPLQKDWLEVKPASQSEYAGLIQTGCGSAILDASWEVVNCGSPCQTAQSPALFVHYFLISRSSTWLIWASYP